MSHPWLRRRRGPVVAATGALAVACASAALAVPAMGGAGVGPWGDGSPAEETDVALGGEQDGVGADGAAGPDRILASAPMAVQARTVAELVEGYAERLTAAEAQRAAAVRTWQVAAAPLRPPPPPEEKPELATEPGHVAGDGLPPVITRVPTDDKVVFLTIDDGAEKDPDLLAMMAELEIPYTSFLTDYVARDDYAYFRKASEAGNSVQNHTISHPEMPTLSRAEQREEICAQQDRLEEAIGERPTMFRPPYGAYDRKTLEAAAECGVEVVPLWAEEAFADRMEWSRGDRVFHPGDIILTHFRGENEWDGTMPDMVRTVVETATEQGFAIARLEDYL